MNTSVVPRITTELPGPKAQALLALSQQHEANISSPQVPLVWDCAEGAVIRDVDGNLFIDFTSGVFVANTGHCHPQHVKAVQDQVACLMNSYDFVTAQRAQLAAKLVEISAPNLDKVFMLTTGGEAVETAMKLARRYTGKHEIISFHEGFHGRTYETMSAGGRTSVKKGFGHMHSGFLHAPFNYCYRCTFEKEPESCDYLCLRYLDRLLETESGGSVAAVLCEAYQGAGGIIVPTREYMQRLARWCSDHDMLLIMDEVQAGFGRTGKMFAYENYDIQPNIVVLGKGLGSGIPTSAVLAESRLFEGLAPGSVSSTYGGNPVACAAALAVIEIMQKEDLPGQAAATGKMLLDRLTAMQDRYPILGEVRGTGLAIGLEIVADPGTKTPAPELAMKIVEESYRRGLLMLSPAGYHTSVLRLCPPLSIPRELAEKGCDLLEAALASVA